MAHALEHRGAASVLDEPEFNGQLQLHAGSVNPDATTPDTRNSRARSLAAKVPDSII